MKNHKLKGGSRTKAELARLARIEFFDDRGEPEKVVWRPREEIDWRAVDGLVAGVTGFRPDGTGESIVLELLKFGFKVVACDRDGQAGRAAAERMRRATDKRVTFVEADIARKSGRDRFMDAIKNAGNVGMIHYRQSLAFRLKASHDGFCIHTGFDDLERYFTTDRTQLLGHVHDAESTLADLLEQLEASDLLAGRFSDWR